ncbi:MAG: tRNA (5-methylaminomethyl-2-thiouridine)(34)-methyltransferase MnmD [Hyphomonadaceae bacterium]|nr:tRNA (5-methylaminomethyl-2-thiouridine)(34)-methyltransferase MnmD [Hyphomonadaceae bacterium]
MPRLPPLPNLDFATGAPYSRDRDDVYFSGEGLSEKRQVFLAGCGLPETWSGRDRFAIGELGFGASLNLLAAWDLWRQHRPSPTARLDYLSFEGFLMKPEDAARIHAMWPELADLSRQLLARWPVRAKGFQRIPLPDGVTLTLAVDEISSALPEARARIDAWFLDGFAPSKNPEMWSPEIMSHVARLSAPGARAATYTVAGDVRRSLEAAGFAVEKKPGHGRKKERLEARFPGEASQAPAPRRIAIIGAGIAGACVARSFLDRGCDVTVYDKGAGPGAAASGNPLALVMPRLDAADGPQARSLIEAYLYARRFYATLGPDAAVPLDAIHRPRGPKEQQRFTKLLADPPLDESLLQPKADGLRHLGAFAVRPSIALPRLLEGATLRFNTNIPSLDDVDADLVIVCAGMGIANFEGIDAPPLAGRLGQLESAASSGSPNAIADGGYALEAFGQLVFGATFEPADGEPKITGAARAENLATLARLRPDLASNLDPGSLTSRAAIRATTPDRFPFVGPLSSKAEAQKEKAPVGQPAPSRPFRLLGGLGARGFLWSPLLAELATSEAFDEPSPAEASVAESLDPGRYLRRALRRPG